MFHHVLCQEPEVLQWWLAASRLAAVTSCGCQTSIHRKFTVAIFQLMSFFYCINWFSFFSVSFTVSDVFYFSVTVKLIIFSTYFAISITVKLNNTGSVCVFMNKFLMIQYDLSFIVTDFFRSLHFHSLCNNYYAAMVVQVSSIFLTLCILVAFWRLVLNTSSLQRPGVSVASTWRVFVPHGFGTCRVQTQMWIMTHL